MMNYRQKILAFLIACVMLISGASAAFASNISGALNSGQIIITNNSTATTDVATTGNWSTQSLIDGGYLNSSANNCAIRNTSGADIPFMPGLGTDVWGVWVPSIGENTLQTNILYTADSSGGEIRYFPRAAGATVADNWSLELTRPLLQFDGTANSDIDFGSIHNATDKIWFSIWWRPDATFTGTVGADRYLLSKNQDGANHIFGRLNNGAGTITFRHKGAIAGEVSITTTQSTWNGGQWYHFLYSISNTNGYRLIVDGGTPQTDANLDAVANTGNIMMADHAGIVNVPSQYTNISIGTDDLTTAEEAALYTQGINGAPPADANNWWRINEGSGTGAANIIDYGTDGNDGNNGVATSWDTNSSFEVSTTAYINTNTGDDKYIVRKGDMASSGVGAFDILVSDNSTSGNITARIGTNSSATWAIPAGFESATSWVNAPNAYDGNTATASTYTFPGAGWSEYYVFSNNATYINGLRYWKTRSTVNINQMQVDVFYDGTWNNVYDGNLVNNATWDLINFSSIELVQWVRMRFNSTAGAEVLSLFEGAYLETNFPQVSATGVSSGEHTVLVSVNATSFNIYIDGALADNATQASVPDTADNYTFFMAAATPYAATANVTIDGLPVSSWEWEYNTVFADQIGGNTMIPSFITDSSDPDVIAYLATFGPITEAKAPRYTLADAPDFMDPGITGNITANFTVTVPVGTFPLAEVIRAVANAAGGGTPVQVPLLIIMMITVLGLSITVTYFMRQHTGAGSLFFKWLVTIIIMSVFLALGNFAVDLWMLIVYSFMSIAIMFMSRHFGMG